MHGIIIKLSHNIFFISAQESGQGSLGPGGIAGIVIALLALVIMGVCAAILIIVIYVMRKNGHQVPNAAPSVNIAFPTSGEGSQPTVTLTVAAHSTVATTVTGNDSASQNNFQAEDSQPSESEQSPGREPKKAMISAANNQGNNLTTMGVMQAQDAGQGAANNSSTTADGPGENK